jgi:hypothetical protein
LIKLGGETGIRTLDPLLADTHFPGVRLRPLGHLSEFYKERFFNAFMRLALTGKLAAKLQKNLKQC